jgi:CheY-like chemotaxis protein
MQVVAENAEHFFLAMLEKIARAPAGWAGLHIPLSARLAHEELLARPDLLRERLAVQREEGAAIAADAAAVFPEATVFAFGDGDVIALMAPGSDAAWQELRDFAAALSARIARPNERICLLGNLAKDLDAYQKLADRRLRFARRIRAYDAVGDLSLTRTIALRRARREDPLVMIVEDDRFTTSYAIGLLNKEYDVVAAKSGEEAILSYVESAPDVVLLDLHLPGLNGIETLQALRTTDPEAFVIMASVDTVKQNVVKATALGASGFLKKPFSKDRLIATVEKSPYIDAARKRRR